MYSKVICEFTLSRVISDLITKRTLWPCSDLCLKQLGLRASFVCLLYLSARSSFVKPKFKKESPSGLKKKFLRCYRNFLNRLRLDQLAFVIWHLVTRDSLLIAFPLYFLSWHFKESSFYSHYWKGDSHKFNFDRSNNEEDEISQ